MPSRGIWAVLDFLLAGFLLYVGVWVYELANLASLTLIGFHSSLDMSGLLPVGVSGMSTDQGLGVLTKVIQIAMAVGAVSPLLIFLRRSSLLAAKFAVIGTMSTYCVSAFWEALSSSWIPASPAGQAAFAGLNVVTMSLLVLTLEKLVGLGCLSEDVSHHPLGAIQLRCMARSENGSPLQEVWRHSGTRNDLGI